MMNYPEMAPFIQSLEEAFGKPSDYSGVDQGIVGHEMDHAPPFFERYLRSLVLEHSNLGNYTMAIALLDELIACNPDSAMDYNNRGLMYFNCGEYDQALADYNQAIALNPRLDSAYNNRANCYIAQGQLADAIADYQIALDFNPANWRAWINQGITYRDMGLYDLAIENFDLVLVLGKRLKARSYGERGRTYHLRGDWNLAMGDYQRALESLSNTLPSRRYRKQIQQWLEELLNPMTA
ncbi:tetratricopeptide repeat protein [Spirulina subsalsa]|nr:tetratricopeptide repeat protein [Spirulina subsalsa]